MAPVDASELLLQFSLRGLDTNNLNENLYKSITDVVSPDKICAVQITPSDKWPQGVVIQCVDQETKSKIIQTGLTLNGSPVELNEGGIGTKKIIVRGAPLDMPNHVIIDEMKKYGDYVGIKSQSFYAGRVKTGWSNGTRMVFLRGVREALPPVLKLSYNGFDIKVTLSYEGLSKYECKWCKIHIERNSDHRCAKKPVRSCFNCKSTDHVNAECPHPKACRICQSTSHMAKDCRLSVQPVQIGDQQLPMPNDEQFPPLVPPRTKRKRVNTAGASMSNANTSSPLTTDASLNESIRNQTHGAMFGAEKLDCVVLGTSNCTNLPLKGDDAVELNVDLVVQGGLKIGEASNKLSSDIPPASLLAKNAAVLHVGSTDFPVSGDGDIDVLYTSYVDLVVDVGLKCPNAKIYISSIPPRKGSLNAKINRDIKKMNERLEKLEKSEHGSKITYVNNDVLLTDNLVTLASLYDLREWDDIHLSSEGKSQLANYLFDHMKNDLFREKLQLTSDWEENV